MAQDLTLKRRDLASLAVALAKKAQDLVVEISEWRTFYTDNGFNQAGTNAFVQSDFDGFSDLSHLTPTIIEQFYTDIGNVNLNASQKTTMRKTAKIPIS